MSPRVARRTLAFFKLVYKYWFRVESSGHGVIPEKEGAILAANHGGVLPFDATMVVADGILGSPHPRLARTVVDRWAGALPFVNVFYARVGQVIGTRENVRELLGGEAARAGLPRRHGGNPQARGGSLRAAVVPPGLRRGVAAPPRADHPRRDRRRRRPGAADSGTRSRSRSCSACRSSRSRRRSRSSGRSASCPTRCATRSSTASRSTSTRSSRASRRTTRTPSATWPSKCDAASRRWSTSA